MDSNESSRVLQEVKGIYRKMEANRTNTDSLRESVRKLFNLMADNPLLGCVKHLLLSGAMPLITDFLHNVEKDEVAYYHGMHILLELIHADLDEGRTRTDDRAVLVAIDGLFCISMQSAVATSLQAVISRHSTFVCQLRDCDIEEALIDLALDMQKGESYHPLVQLAASLNEDHRSKELLLTHWEQRNDFILQTLRIMKSRMDKGKDHDLPKTLQKWLPILKEALELDLEDNVDNVALALQVLLCFFLKADHPYGDIVKDSGLATRIVELLAASDVVAVEALRCISLSASNKELCKEYDQHHTYHSLWKLLQRSDDKVLAGTCCALRGLAAGLHGNKFTANYDVIGKVLDALQTHESNHVKESLMLFLTEVVPQLQSLDQILMVTWFLFQKLLVAFTTDNKSFVLNNLIKCLKRLRRVDWDKIVEVPQSGHADWGEMIKDVVDDLTHRLCHDPNEHIRRTAGRLLFTLVCARPPQSR